MRNHILMLLGVLALVGQVGCGDNVNSQPDGAIQVVTDMGSAGCVKPSDTCVTITGTNTHNDIINGCVAGDVVKVDITPFFPDNGYSNRDCKLPAAP